MKTTDTTCAAIILQQLGGNKFTAMTGAKNFTATADNALQFSLPGGAFSRSINRVTIRLDPSDTYTIEFSRISHRNGVFKLVMVDMCEDVYNDNLRDVFTRVTGLATSLGNRPAG